MVRGLYSFSNFVANCIFSFSFRYECESVLKRNIEHNHSSRSLGPTWLIKVSLDSLLVDAKKETFRNDRINKILRLRPIRACGNRIPSPIARPKKETPIISLCPIQAITLK